MCGIAGIAGRRDDALVQSMTETLRHRGPDDAGYYHDTDLSLGHRRLKVLDLETGDQPMCDADGQVWVVYNGEIYNYLELRKALEAKGHHFRTQSDTEVLLHVWLEYGQDCVDHLQGMFAFALWDKREQQLFLARDPLGVKPLYYSVQGDTLYFASEMKAILSVPEFPRDLDQEALDDYLTFLYTVPPRTMFKAIRQLPPGHCATWKNGQWQDRRYWHLNCNEACHSESEWIEAVQAQLQDTMDKYMLSDVPLGAFLSGGLDSASIVHHMTRHATQPVDTFTVGFEGEGAILDERAEARALAKHFSTTHHELTVPSDVTGLMDTLLHHFDEPFGNPTALLSYAICEQVRKQVTVVLSGDGGDESFGGYPRYAGVGVAQKYRAIPRTLRAMVNPLIQCLPESTSGNHALRRLRQFSAGSLLSPVDMLASWLSYQTDAQRAALYSDSLQQDLQGRQPLDHIRVFAAECAHTDPMTQAMYIDVHAFLPTNVLQYGDRMSMAHGLETRVPLADPKLVELLMTMPSSLKVQGMETKVLLRKAMKGKLPEADRTRKKLGFNPPMGTWLNTTLKPLLNEHLSVQQIEARGLFQADTVQKMIQDHQSSCKDNTLQLWSLLLLERWFQTAID